MSVIQNRSRTAFFGAPPGSNPADLNLGGFVVSGNTAVTNGVGFIDLDLGLTGVLSSNTVGWTLSDVGTGEITYQGATQFSGVMIASMSFSSPAPSMKTTFRAVLNGSPLTEGVLTASVTNANVREATLVVPITVSLSDTLRIQLETDTPSSDVVVVNLSMQCH